MLELMAFISVCVGGAGFEVRLPGADAQQALGHNSKAVHHACSKHAEVTVPSLDDWEKEWERKTDARCQKSEGGNLTQPKLLPVVFRSPLAAIAQSN